MKMKPNEGSRPGARDSRKRKRGRRLVRNVQAARAMLCVEADNVVGVVRYCVVPSEATLAKYGMTSTEWRSLFVLQGGLCAICYRPRRLVIDHEHVKGYKKLPPWERRAKVRGLCCWTCNWVLVRRGITPELLESAAKYLRSYASRTEQDSSDLAA